ncbi:MAG: hypothetical protein M1827_000129 [Pycnora praestabilis]|nr:MAG: hypothetical protein M1827_000129 [Pycnora praestabilis]
MILRKFRSPSTSLLRYASSKRSLRGPWNTIPRATQPAKVPQAPENARNLSKHNTSKVEAVSDALRDANAQDNNLLAPVHVPEDPNSILKENHPATSILRNSAIVVQRQLELMNVMIGFEQANKYVIMDPQGNHIGFMAEQDSGLGSTLARQWFRTHRSFTTHVFDKNEREVLRFNRPFSWISSRIRVYDPLEPASSSYSQSTALQGTTPGSLTSDISGSSAQVSSLALSDMSVIGEAQQQWAPLRRKYNLFVFQHGPSPENRHQSQQIASGDLLLTNSRELQVSHNWGGEGEYGQFAYVDEPFLSWDFSLMSADSRLIGSVNRNFAGFGREIFTDTGVYALRMDAAGLADEPRHLISQTGSKADSAYDIAKAGMTLDQRAVMLATAVSVDFDYFSRKSGAGGMGMMPWMYGGGGATTEGAAGETGAAGSTGGTLENIPHAGKGLGEGAAVGAGTMAGYEGLRGVTGRGGDDASPTAGQATPNDPGAGQGQPPQSQPGQGEEIWGEDDNPWSGGQGSQGGGGDVGGGGGGGGDGDGGSFLDSFF